MIETRKTEIRYVTSDPKKMLNMYLAKRVLKTWEESFIDEDTGETVTIERNEILFDRGTLIDQDTLAKIRFSMEADGIKEVEVSNQNRLAFENENKFLYPYLAQAQIGDKKHKFLLYATGLENSCSILKDYIELNYMFGFTLTMVKEFDSCVILTDNLKERKVDDATLEELKDTFLLNDSVTEEDEEEGDSKPNERDMSSERGKSIQPLNLLNLSRSGVLFRKSFQWLIWNNFVNLPARSVKIWQANMEK